LIACTRAPARWFLEQRLGIRLPYQDEAPADEEPFHLDGLGTYKVAEVLVAAHLTGDTAQRAYRRLKAQGVLPSAAAGRRLFEQAWQDSAAFAQRLAPYLAAPRADVEFNLSLAGGNLSGRLHALTAQGPVAYRYGRLRVADRLALWLRHLALNASTGEAICSRFVAPDETVVLQPPPNAAALLEDLIVLARQGLNEPLPLLPECSFAYASARGEPEKRMAKARQVWTGNRHQNMPGAGDDAHVQLAFRGRDPLAEPAFVQLAERVFGPLLAATQAPSKGHE